MTNTVVVWDWDDTLIDATPLFVATYHELAKHYPCYWFEEDRSELLVKDWVSFWASCPLENKKEAKLYYDEAYMQLMENKIELLPQAKEALLFFASLNMEQVLVSNKLQYMLEKETEQLGVKSFFSFIQGTSRLYPEYYKPQPCFAQKISDKLIGKNLIAIGDKKSDMLFANQLGAQAFWIQQNEEVPHLLKQDEFTCWHVRNLSDVMAHFSSNTEQISI